MSIKEGDIVSLANEVGRFLVIEIEKKDDPSLGCKLDMGRYTLLAKDGTEYRNSPGYLMKVIGHFVGDGE